MVIIDTSVWIEFLRGNQPFFDQVSGLLERGDVLSLSCVFGELLQGAKGARERSTIRQFWENLPRGPEEGLLVRAGAEAGRNGWFDKGIGLIDSAIVVASRETSAFVWTLDKKLAALLRREEQYRPS
jgi:predicted nucleic acid-binding protein